MMGACVEVRCPALVRTKAWMPTCVGMTNAIGFLTFVSMTKALGVPICVGMTGGAV